MTMVNGLYDVPQTDQMSEAAMAALVARLRVKSTKPEALTPISDAAMALHVVEAIGDITSALGDRLGPDVTILKWDSALDGKCIALAMRNAYFARGLNRQAGADNTIEAMGKKAEDYLARLRPGGDVNGKTETPRFVASTGEVGDRGRFNHSPRSDSWVTAQRQARGY